MRSLAAALQFLTILPIRTKTYVAPGKAAIWYPLAGALIGAGGAAVFYYAGRWLPMAVASFLAVLFWIAISGALHEDGFGDIADAIRAGRSRDLMLQILKDSRVGTYGAVAVFVSFTLRWQALQFFATPRWLEVMIASQVMARASMVALAWVSRPLDTGLGYELASTLSSPVAIAVIVQGAIAALFTGWRSGIALIVGTWLILRLLRWFFESRLGGVNGDCLGAAGQIIEILTLLLFTCGRCQWT
jgi:adenosylcobinamide-GDP ribazoletransferase